MIDLSEKFVDPPKIQPKTKQTAYPDNNIIGIHIESREFNDDGFKNYKGQQYEKKGLFFECIIKDQQDQRGIKQVIIFCDLLIDGHIPLPVKYLRRIDNRVDHPENGNDHIGLVFSQPLIPIQN